MTLKLYNTLTRTKEAFTPFDPANVRMYVCGPTVYDFAHIGNARPVVVFDVLYRLLRREYGEKHVTYVRNITDVDDKIIEAAKKAGDPIAAITTRFTDEFHADMAALGTLEPDVEPRATLHIPEMIALIEKLIAGGYAYVADGHALFAVGAFPRYGKLSGRSRDEQIAGARVEIAPYKKDPADFVLWKPSSSDQPGWDSPWGLGRPGWHLECSAMSEKHLGPLPFDIHGGGLDLVFPHHENEIAQSECAHADEPARDGVRFAKYWLHNGWLTMNGEKMSKSLGNFFTVRDLLAKAPGEAIRLMLLKTHYRSPLDFSESTFLEARNTYDYWYRTLKEVPNYDWEESGVDAKEVLGALQDDLNTVQAIVHLNEYARAANTTIGDDQRKFAAKLKVSAEFLGLLGDDPLSALKWQPSGAAAVDEDGVARSIDARLAARKAKNFAEADRIRAELLAKGIVLEDKPGGRTEWWRAR